MRTYTEDTQPADPYYVFELAYRWARETDNSNAKFCYDEAIKAEQRGDWLAMANWSVKSLDHSIGILHREHPMGRLT